MNYYVIFAVFFRLLGGVAADFAYVVLIFYSLKGNKEIIYSFMIAWFFNMINPEISQEGVFTGVTRYLFILIIAARLVFQKFYKDGSFCVNTNSYLTGILSIVMLFHSIVVSPDVSISVLKILSWALVMMSLFSAWSGLEAADSDEVSENLYKGLIFIFAASIPFLILPAGYSRNETGFQGVLNHPQGFGPTMAIFCVWTLARLASKNDPKWVEFFLFVAGFVFSVLSEARTAVFSVIIGILAAIFGCGIYSGGRMASIVPGFFGDKFIKFMMSLVLLMVLAGSFVYDIAEEFLNKRADSTTSILDAYDNSRGQLIEAMKYNIENNLLFGIGFGVASNLDEMTVKRDPYFGLPLSATIEKGVMPLAVIEELGLIIGGVFAAWALYMMRRAVKGGIVGLSLYFTIYLLNMGESTFFSSGGLGLLPMIIFSWVSSNGNRKV